MRRRQVLASTAALLPLAGCAGFDGPNEDDETTETTTTTTPPVTDATPNGPKYEGADFQMTNAECATEDATQASVSFGETTVTVEGTIVGADACYVAKLDSVTHDEMEKELAVVVESVREADEDTACAQCITAIDYALTARFSDGLPDRVVVSHKRGEAVTEVAAVTRS
jgi:hypothetical protein